MSSYNRKCLKAGREKINRCRNFSLMKLTFSGTVYLKIEEIGKMASVQVDNSNCKREGRVLLPKLAFEVYCVFVGGPQLCVKGFEMLA